MHEEVKASLNRIFEAELLQHKKKKARTWLPQLTMAGIIMVGLLLWASGTWTERTAYSPVEQGGILDLRGTYVGDNSRVGRILSYALSEESFDSFALQTKQQPYGIIVHMPTLIRDETQQKVAFYIWTLVQNADYIQFEANGENVTLTRKMFSTIDFSAIHDEATLNGTKPLPLNMQHEALTAVLVEAINTAQQEPAIVNLLVNDADYVFDVEGERYYLWLNEGESVFTKQSDTGLLYKLSAQTYQQLQALLIAN
ncbi:DUF4825 domain-containing protein [Metasolibacillus meyeri]|uniref:DUF4825 domain-containing protein n=1 Tax=Metasolibacillus meyeri TaxID=1071052 RepID=A0AAW9NWD5_9BACL|nr:DUF4825 domain-containing protein [Metasolibacillus meyeri]MEC1179814.1 DUF4825 domain-containing protein [Metasolibacillus meyeri]